MFLLCFPICLLANPILELWLGIVPEYTTIFLQIIIVQSLFQVFDTSFYTALYAKGQLKENALISPMLLFLGFPVVFLLFKLGHSPIVFSWISLSTYIILGLIVKPLLIIKIVNYQWSDIWSVFKPCIFVTLAALPIPLFCSYMLDIDSLWLFLLMLFITIFSSLLSIYLIGIDGETKYKLRQYVNF